MKKITQLIGFFILCMILSSCGILSKEPYTPVKLYDLGQAEKIDNRNYNLEVNVLTTNGPYRTKMLYRINKCQIVLDEYNRWVQTPNLLITRYLQDAFIQSSTDKNHSFKIVGELICFDIDLKQKTALLTIEVELYSTDKQKQLFKQTLSFKEKIAEESPEHIAEAMSSATRKFVQKLNHLILLEMNKQSLGN